MTPEAGPTPLVDDVVVGEEAEQNEWQRRDKVETNQYDLERNGSLAGLNLPQADVEPGSPQHGCSEEKIMDSQSSPPAPLRRSTRQRHPGQMLIYSSLGQPTYQSRPTVNAIDIYRVPSADLWYPQPYLPSFPGPPFTQFTCLPFLYTICSY